MPISNELLRHGYTTAAWILAPLGTTAGCGVSMAFTAMQIAINDISPSHHTLGTLNGIALTVSAAVQTVMPPLMTSIFAFGVSHHILHGHLAWIVMILVSGTIIPALFWFPRKADGIIK